MDAYSVDNYRFVTVVVLLLLLPLLTQTVIADDNEYPYDEDGWLTRIAGPERFSLGDEFGCQGMPDIDPFENPDSVASCRSYLTERVEASRWGASPITFGLQDGTSDSTLNQNIGDALVTSGFQVSIGPSIGDERIQAIEFDAGSLEKNVASIEAIEASMDDGTPVVLRWIAELGDLNVRKDPDVLAWIEDQPFWFTTAGEYHTSKTPASITPNGSNSIILNQPSVNVGEWSTPGTSVVSLVNSTEPGLQVESVRWMNGTDIPLLDEMDRHLRVGWRVVSGEVYVSIAPGDKVEIQFSSSIDEVEIEVSDFNGLTPMIVIGEHVTDLFEWSSGFQDSSIRFTWLVEPRPVAQMDIILPVIALVVGVLTVFQMRRLINRDNPNQFTYRSLFEQE